MTMLACIPVTGAPTLAEVGAASLNAADNTYTLQNAVDVLFEDNGNTSILTLYEANRGVQLHAHGAVGNAASIDSGTVYPSPSSIIWNVQENLTGVLGWTSGIALGLGVDADNDGAFVVGVDLVVSSDANNTANGMSLYGLQFGVNHNGSGTGEYLYGLLGYSYVNAGNAAVCTAGDFSVGIFNGASADEASGITVEGVYSGGGATITAAYGVLIRDINTGTSNYAIQTNAGHVVFNEGSDNDTDFRVEGATDANLLMVDGSADTVQIGAATVSDSAKFYVSGKISTSSEIEINGDLNHDGSNIGFYATAPAAKQTVTGSRGGNAALASLLTGLATIGLITDSSSA